MARIRFEGLSTLLGICLRYYTGISFGLFAVIGGRSATGMDVRNCGNKVEGVRGSCPFVFVVIIREENNMIYLQ